MDIKRIVPSKGCDFFLIQTQEKAVLIDTGMFHCGEYSMELVKEELQDRPLDYIILSHTHYDHVGGLPALRKAYPNVKVFGSEYAAYVLQRDGARRVMRTLASAAAKTYLGEDAVLCEYDEDALFIDEVLREGDIIDLGSSKLHVYSALGHTKCSLAFFEPESGSLFLSESTGVYVDPSWVDVSILTGYNEAIQSVEKFAGLKANILYIPHYGKLDEISPEAFFDLSKRSAESFRNLVLDKWAQGCSDEEVMCCCRDLIWATKVQGHEDQPVDAFDANTKAFLEVLKREFPA